MCQTNLRPLGLGGCGGLTDSVIRVIAVTPAIPFPVLKLHTPLEYIQNYLHIIASKEYMISIASHLHLPDSKHPYSTPQKQGPHGDHGRWTLGTPTPRGNTTGVGNFMSHPLADSEYPVRPTPTHSIAQFRQKQLSTKPRA